VNLGDTLVDVMSVPCGHGLNTHRRIPADCNPSDTVVSDDDLSRFTTLNHVYILAQNRVFGTAWKSGFASFIKSW
jgi:hypothetical protein